MVKLAYGSDYKYIPTTSLNSGKGEEVAPDVFVYTIQIVNIVLVGQKGLKDFVLIDAGMPKSSEKIIEVIEERFGEGAAPKAIILTHGHFDHVGAVVDLVEKWQVPVYAHALELPYLTGKQAYPTPDTSVEGGLVSKMSTIFPIQPIQLGSHVQALPADGTIPALPEFRWLPTPGHSVGHISLFRERDRLLIVGDAFITVKQEYMYKVYTQEKEMSGPPRYLTPDWEAAKKSVEQLAALNPEIAVVGHGVTMQGEELRQDLKNLLANFGTQAIPAYGKYVSE